MEDPIETARYELTNDELELLPYTKGEKINFIHSNGYAFDFNVTENKIEWKEHHNFCEWNCCGNDYFSYQVKTTILESTYPKFHIEFSLGGTRLNDYYPQTLNMEINHSYFIKFPYDTLTNFICNSATKTIYYDSIALNNQMYYEVIMKNFDSHNFISDSSVLVPMSVYFNNLGMIQLEMSNHETYTINN
ncbi:MAG: hypothetical protein CSA36_04325 [Draconibacterium sp.]|nr:MAG: hypothetical protein CSA36_04325 [Draconibacterium sp.]